MKRIYLLFCSMIAVVLATQAQSPVPAPPQSGAILILGATAHLGNGNIIANSAIGFEKGQLTLVADATTIRIDRTKYVKIYDASGKHVYPGFIAPNTPLGLVEVESVRATVDHTEVGNFNPNARALVAYNTDSEVIPTVRSNGVLLAQITPQGGTVSGTSSVVQLDAWNWEDAAVLADDGIHLNWPALRTFGGFMNPEMRPNERYAEEVQQLHRFFAEAQAYSKQTNPAVKNPRFESMRSLFSKKQTLFLHASAAKSIQEGVLFAEQYGMKVVLTGGTDAFLVTGFLKEHQVPVLLARTQSLPERDDDDVAQSYKNAKLLHDAGIMFGFTNGGSWQQRNLSFQAGQAVGFGLPYEAAVAALSGNTAKILGIDQVLGTLETGKQATLFISEGDALDMRTCQVTAAFIQGREINLDNRQKALGRKYEEKYKRQ